MQNKPLFHLAVFFIILFASCSGGNNSNGSASNGDTTKTITSNSSSSNVTTNSNISLTLTGGDMAGSYSAPCDGCCSYGIAGDKVFGTQYSENGKGPKELSSVQLIVDSVNGNKSTKEFTLTVSFGKLFSADSKSFNINTREGKTQGSGTLDLTYSGDKAVVAIKGTSVEGAGIDLKITCNKVATMDNVGK